MSVPPYGECFNPTEAGGGTDWRGMDTMSEIKKISTDNNRMETTVSYKVNICLFYLYKKGSYCFPVCLHVHPR